MTCEPFCDTCGGNRGRGGSHFTCEKCLRSCRKERIRKEEFEYDNYSHFALRTRGGAWRYYRRVDPLIYIGDGMYRAKSLCSLADLERAAMLNSNANIGKL